MVSAAVPVAGIGAALTFDRHRQTRPVVIVTGLILSFSVAAMHFVGMNALIVQARIHYDGIAIAQALAIGTLFLTLSICTHRRLGGWARIIVPVALGALGIVTLHFGAMGSTTLIPGGVEVGASSHLIERHIVSRAVIIAMALVALTMIAAAVIGRDQIMDETGDGGGILGIEAVASGTGGGADMEMDMAVAQMPEARGMGAGEARVAGRRRLDHEARHRIDRHGDVMLHRRPQRPLGIGQRVTQKPKGLGLRIRHGDHRIGNDPLGQRAAELRLQHRGRTGARAAGYRLAQATPGLPALQRRPRAGQLRAGRGTALGDDVLV